MKRKYSLLGTLVWLAACVDGARPSSTAIGEFSDESAFGTAVGADGARAPDAGEPTGMAPARVEAGEAQPHAAQSESAIARFGDAGNHAESGQPLNADASGTAATPVSGFSPAPGSVGVPVDTPLRLRFDAPPVIDAAAVVTIFRVRDGQIVDSVAAGVDIDRLGPEQGANGGRLRSVRRVPISVQGSELWVQLHQGILDYDEDYRVGVVGIRGTVDGASLAETEGERNWVFHTRVGAPTGVQLVVDDDGPADFRTVQGALDYAMAELGADEPAEIRVRSGRYHELLYLRGKNRLSVVGESRESVVVDYENFEGFNPGTGRSSNTLAAEPDGGRALLLVEGVDLLTLDSLTLLNTHQRTGTGDQAETLYFNADGGRMVARNAAFVSEQDTLQLKGYSWFYRSLVAGNVDFIWGGNRAALFEECEIRTLGDSRRDTASGGYVLQARTVTAQDPGFVFLRSRLTHADGPAGTPVATGASAATYLARSGGSEGYFDNVAFLECSMGSHIASAGWAGAGINGQPAPNPPVAGLGSGWREYGSVDEAGAPLDVSLRVAAARTLSEAEATALSSREQVFAGFGASGWTPQQ